MPDNSINLGTHRVNSATANSINWGDWFIPSANQMGTTEISYSDIRRAVGNWGSTSTRIHSTEPIEDTNMTREKIVRKLVEGIVQDRLARFYATSIKLYFGSMPDWLEGRSLRSVYERLLQEFPEIDTMLWRCARCDDWRSMHDNRYNINISDGYYAHWCGGCTGSFSFSWSDGTRRTYREPSIERYHNTNRNVLYEGVDFNAEDLLGIELETFIRGSSTQILDVATSAANKFHVAAERDGSLDHVHGVEFIFRPIEFSALNKENEVRSAVEYLAANKTLAWDAGTGYGMHISINASKMNDLHVGKFCTFINKHRDLGERIGGRVAGNYHRFCEAQIKDFRNTTEKYLAASRRSESRVEVRLFRATLHWPRILRNCEFVDSVRVFTSDTSMRELSVDNYLRWLAKNNNAKKYRHLRDFLGIHRTKEIARRAALELEYV